MLEGMPLDVLVDILRLVLVQDLPIDTHGPMRTPKGKYQKEARSRSGDCLKTITLNDLSLLAVSHAIRGVALPIFWRENTFRIYARTTAGAKVRSTAWRLMSNVFLKETNEIQISTKFLRLQQQPTVNLARKLEMELAFGERRRVSTLHEFLCSQFSSLAKIEGLDNTGRLIIDARVETEWGRPQVVICDSIVDQVVKDFATRFAWRFPNLDLKSVTLDFNIRQAWCVAHAPDNVVPQLFIGCIGSPIGGNLPY